MSKRQLQEAFLSFDTPGQALDQINPDPEHVDSAEPGVTVSVAGAGGYLEEVSAKEHLQSLLALLRALHWEYYTSHWRVRGSTFYGDHLLFQRLYDENMPEEIDALAEKLVFKYGEAVIDPTHQMKMGHTWLQHIDGILDWHDRGLRLEELLQDQIKRTYDMLDMASELTLGIDDFLMTLANAHESNMYLLKQPMG